MANETLTEMLIGQPERKLLKLRHGIHNEITRLSMELRLVDEAIARKHARGGQVPSASRPTNGHADGMSRRDYYDALVEMGRPAKPVELREFLIAKGIDRRTEAVRNSLMRLVDDGALDKRDDGTFAVRDNGGSQVEAENPLPDLGFESPGLQPG